MVTQKLRGQLLSLIACVSSLAALAAMLDPDRTAGAMGLFLVGVNGYSQFYAIYVGVRLATAALALLAPGFATAQLLPVQVHASGNVATVDIGLTPLLPIADLTFTFDDASQLSASSLGVTARLVNLLDPVLQARLGGEVRPPSNTL